jgi:hypothetical protein
VWRSGSGRHIERRTGRCPTPGKGFEAMLDHALEALRPGAPPLEVYRSGDVRA